jgi:hypothetical protein
MANTLASAVAPPSMPTTADYLPRFAGLSRLSLGLAIFGGIFAYGVTKPNEEAKWLGGIGLLSIGVEYFACKRMLQLTAPAPATTALAVAPGVDYIPPPQEAATS